MMVPQFRQVAAVTRTVTSGLAGGTGQLLGQSQHILTNSHAGSNVLRLSACANVFGASRLISCLRRTSDLGTARPTAGALQSAARQPSLCALARPVEAAHGAHGQVPPM